MDLHIMFITTKLKKYYLFIVLILTLFVWSPNLYAQKYSIDKESKAKKTRIHISFRHLFKKDATKAAAKQIKKDEKHKTKVLKNEQKNNKTYQKKANNNNEKGKDQKVYVRMRKYEKQAKKRRANKPTKNVFQRFFSKSKAHKKSKK